MDDKRLSRRGFLTAGAAVGSLPAAKATAALLGGGEPPWQEGRAAAPQAVDPNAASWAFFTAAEAAFITAATGRLIPADDLGPGAVEAGVPVFIDRQLAGAYGRAERWYMQGPWAPGLPTQGYQTRLTPAGLYRAGIKAVDAAVGREQSGARFAALAPDAQDAVLHRLEKGELDLDGVDAKAFFAQLLQNTLEGFWSDPIYGGNRGMAGWKLIGFPGARYDQAPYVQQHGQPYPLPPVGLSGRVEWIRSTT